VAAADVPGHAVLAAGFPCQPFSLAGVSKKTSLGRKHGFEDLTQGTLFFEILRIVSAHRPPVLLLENVKHLKRHDRGRTFQVIVASLAELDYVVTTRVIDSAQLLPQHRERIFMIALDARKYGSCHAGEVEIPEIWHEVEQAMTNNARTLRQQYRVPVGEAWPVLGPLLEHSVPERYGLTPGLWAYLQAYRAKHAAAGNGFGFSVVNGSSPYTRTISARYYKDGSEALIERLDFETPRRLTPLECSRLQGFPAKFQGMFDR
jgi:DNA (cytosine-5)-methyltransferase 1